MHRRQRGEAPEQDVILPAELLEEILNRLPSNDLLKFKIVCKDWLRLISSPEFIQKHLQRSKAESREPRIVESKYWAEIEILSYCANTLTGKKVKKIRGFGRMRLLGSCDGLVLYIDHPFCQIRALNPSTGKIEVEAPLSKSSIVNEILLHSFIGTWFGHHPATGEYVLVIAFAKFWENTSIVFKVYGLSRNSLLFYSTEDLDSISSICIQDIGIFLHGRLHVMSLKVVDSPLDWKTDILAYDLQANRMLRMRSPLHYCPALGIVDGCLCALHMSQVWVMKEYGVEESWFKYANIDDKISIPLQIYQNDDAILCDDFLKAIRDAPTELLNGNKCFIRRGVVCIDSLVSPAVVWG